MVVGWGDYVNSFEYPVDNCSGVAQAQRRFAGTVCRSGGVRHEAAIRLLSAGSRVARQVCSDRADIRIGTARLHAPLRLITKRTLTIPARIEFPETTRPLRNSHQSNPIPAIAPQRTQAILHNLVRGARIVIGSLDVSGARHEILLTRHGEIVRPLGSLSVVSGVIGEILPRQLSEDPLSILFRSQQHTLGLSSSAHRNPTDNATSVVGLRSVTPLQSRVFLTPHFGDSGTVHEPAKCRTDLRKQPSASVSGSCTNENSKTPAAPLLWHND